MVEITLKNVSGLPVVSLAATLTLNRAFDFTFDISGAKPWAAGSTISARQTLITGSFDDSLQYPLKISGTFQNGAAFVVTDQVKITPPPSTPGATPTTTTFSPGQNSTSVVSQNGLTLSLSLDSAGYHSGDKILITVDEKNSLANSNNLPAAKNWAIQGLIVGPCGTLNYPFGIAVLQGNYDLNSLSSVLPLKLYDPGAVYSCPMILAGITAYKFQPSSDMADILTGDNSQPFSINMTAQVTASGLWAGSPAAFSNFMPGDYTLVGGDEWGAVAVLHFRIS